MESTGRVENGREKRRRDDRVLPETRLLSAIIVPFLGTQDLFAIPDSR